MRRLLLVLTLALTLAPLGAAAQVPGMAAANAELPRDPAVTVGALPNGVRYYIRRNAMPQGRAELRLAVNAGSVLEDESQQGLAHFVEHMAFNGTDAFEKQEIVSYLERVGMRFGSHLNAYTSFDETVYMLQVPTDSAAVLQQGIRILEEWAHNVTFDSTEIEKERGVVIEEWRLGQGAGERMRKQYWPTLFQGSRYAERLPIGQVAVLQSFPRAELVRFYETWYRPDNMAVIAVGDFDPAAVERMIRETFGRIPPAASPYARPTSEVPGHAETLVSIATDAEAPGTIVEVMWKLPAQRGRDLETYRRSLLQSLHSGMLNARLGEIAQKPDAPFLGAGSSYGALVRARDSYSLGASVPNGGAERGLEAVLTEAERVLRHGFTATELERQKTNLLRAYEQAYAERDKSESAAYAQEYVSAFLEDEPFPGIEAEYRLVEQLLPTITVQELNTLGRTWMSDRNRSVIVMAPEQADVALPTRESLLAVFDRVEGTQVAAYVDNVANVPLVENMPQPGRVVASQKVDGIDATLLTLSNGARVYLMPTTFKDDEVRMGAYSPGGLSLVSDAEHASGAFAGQLVALSGLGSMDMIQLNKALAGKAAQVGAAVGEYNEMMSGVAAPKDLETLFQRIYLQFTAPRSDSAAYESFMQRVKASLANRDASPEVAFSDTFSTTMWQNHPRARPQTLAWMNEIERDVAFRIYRDRFADAGDFTFAFVGAFDTAQVRQYAEQYIASLPALERVDTPRDNGMRPVRGVVEKVVRRGIEPKSQTRITFSGPFEYTPENRIAIALMTDVLDMRLRDVLREDLGGTYGVGISQSTMRFPEPRYLLSVSFGSAPERLEELVAAVFAEIERLKQDGPDGEALAKAKEQARRGYETSTQRNEYWLSVLLREAETGESAASALDYVSRVDAVTPAQVQAAARAYLDLLNYVRVSLIPAAGAGT